MRKTQSAVCCNLCRGLVFMSKGVILPCVSTEENYDIQTETKH